MGGRSRGSRRWHAQHAETKRQDTTSEKDVMGDNRKNTNPGPITEDTPESQLPLDYVKYYDPDNVIGYMSEEQGKAFRAKRDAQMEAWRVATPAEKERLWREAQADSES